MSRWVAQNNLHLATPPLSQIQIVHQHLQHFYHKTLEVVKVRTPQPPQIDDTTALAPLPPHHQPLAPGNITMPRATHQSAQP